MSLQSNQSLRQTPLDSRQAIKLLLKAVGGLIALLSIALLAPFVMAVVSGEKEQWTYLTLSIIGLVVGLGLFLQPIGDAKLRAPPVYCCGALCCSG